MNRKKRNKKIENKSKRFLVASLLFIIIFLIGAIIIWIKVWRLEKFILVNKATDGGGEIYIIDSKNDKVLKYQVSPDVILNSANGFGEYKISSLWTLGKKENLYGQLVSRSISSNFLIPIYLWKDGRDTNLNLFQKIKFLTLSKYSVTDMGNFDDLDLPSSVLINFIDVNIQENGIEVLVEDLTGEQESIQKLSKIIDVLGSKVSNYTKGYDQNLDCEIYSNDPKIRHLLTSIFGCKSYTHNSLKTIKIRLGAKFADRF